MQQNRKKWPWIDNDVALEIVEDITEVTGVTLFELRSDRRSKHLVLARNDAMYRLQQELGWSSPVIGDFFNRDHSTVLYAIKRHIKLSEAAS